MTAIHCVMLYGAYIGNQQMHPEVWMMIFPIAFAPVVAARERIYWFIASAASFVSMMLLRPEPLTMFRLLYLPRRT